MGHNEEAENLSWQLAIGSWQFFIANCILPIANSNLKLILLPILLISLSLK
jgi:hypothetical protein